MPIIVGWLPRLIDTSLFILQTHSSSGLEWGFPDGLEMVTCVGISKDCGNFVQVNIDYKFKGLLCTK